MKKDKLIIGIISGIIGTIFLQISMVLSLPTNPKHTFWEYASFVAFGHKTHGFDFAVAVLIQIFFSIALVAAWSYIRDLAKTEYIKTRGAIFGGGIWFLIQALMFVFKTPIAKTHSGLEALWEFTTAIIFGIIADWVIDKFEKR